MHRAPGGPTGVLAAVALVILFASAVSWVWTTLGLLLRTPTAVMNLGFVILFPVSFLSRIFVAPDTMPSWLHHIADANPISHLASNARHLMNGTATAHQILGTVAISAAIMLLFAPITIVLYQRHE